MEPANENILAQIQVPWAKHLDDTSATHRYSSEDGQGLNGKPDKRVTERDGRWYICLHEKDKQVVPIDKIPALILQKWEQERFGRSERQFGLDIASDYTVKREDVKFVLRFRGSSALPVHPISELPTLYDRQWKNPVETYADVWFRQLPAFIQRISNVPSTGTELDHCFNIIKATTKFGRIPKIYVLPDLLYGPGNASFEDADVIYVSRERAPEVMQLSQAKLAGKFVMVRDTFPPSPESKDPTASFLEYIGRFPEMLLDTQDYSRLLQPGVYSKTVDPLPSVPRPKIVAEVLADLESGELRLTPEKYPTNLLNLRSRGPDFRPYFLQEERLTLLDTIINEMMYYATGSLGKTAAPKYPREVDIYQFFEIFGDKYSASGFHKDNLGFGTFIYCQAGQKMWPIIPRPTPAEMFSFRTRGDEWIPDDPQSVPVAYIQRGEGILMLPGNENLHAPFTLECCLMKGVNYWDESCIGIILQQIRAQLENPRCGNEGLPERTRELIQALYVRTVKGQYDEYVQIACVDLLKELDAICECVGMCKKDRCLCVQGGFICSSLCHHDHIECSNEKAIDPKNDAIQKDKIQKKKIQKDAVSKGEVSKRGTLRGGQRGGIRKGRGRK